MKRDGRIVETADGRWRALTAWRGRGDVGLLYFIRLEDGAPSDRADEDRRASLEPGEQLADLGDDELRRRLSDGTPLTGTERRFRAPDGELWLAQSVGPVWAEGDVAAGLTGVVFTALEGEPRRLTGDGVHVGEVDQAALVGCWRTAGGGHGDDGDASGAGD